MKDHSGANQSIWVRSVTMLPGAPIQTDRRAEVCVIGAGIAGVTTAYLLRKAGKKVTLIDADLPGSGQTARTTAHLAWAIDDRIHEVERIHGTDIARLAVDSHRHAIDTIESIVKAESITCEFARVPGYLSVGDGTDPSELDRELEALSRIGRTEVGFGYGPLGKSLIFPNQGRFQPLKYLQGLVKAFTDAGGVFHGGSRVKELAAGTVCKLTLENGSHLEADVLVVATNSPISNRFSMQTKMHPYLTFAIAIEIAKETLPDALLWDTADPYHYVRLHSEGEREFLIVGGEDHKTGHTGDGDPYQKLELWARRKFQRLGKVHYQWSGQVLETLDGLAFIGQSPGNPSNVFVACGDSGMGLTHGTIAGTLIRDLVLGRKNPLAEVYNPSRKSLETASDFILENIDLALQYRDYFTSGDLPSTDQIAPGHGAVIREGLSKIAVFRTESGELRTCSAICPHLGAIVRWNQDEQTWDCPAHGSRFAPSGECIQGPAICGLTALKQHAENV